MCGIIGIIGKAPVTPLLVDALKRLEYRGYDSAGVATLVNGHIERRRAEGKLVKLVERHAHARVFNEPGTPAYERDGAFTCESSLASSTAFIIGEIGDVSEREIAALQVIVAETVERDRQVPIASTLAENVARVLHGLRPRRFPKTVMDPGTNHLRNPEAFIPRR